MCKDQIENKKNVKGLKMLLGLLLLIFFLLFPSIFPYMYIFFVNVFNRIHN